MELFDIVDASGCPTGETVERSQAHALGLRHRTAHIWVVKEEAGTTYVLLQKRAGNKDSFPGRFDTSSAGHIQAGDEPLESAVRELGEELGIHAAPEELEFAGTFRIRYEKEFYGKLFRDNEVSFVYAYRKPVDIRSLHLQEEEVSCVEWFPLDTVYEECKKHNQKFCVPLDGLETIRSYLQQHSHSGGSIKQ